MAAEEKKEHPSQQDPPSAPDATKRALNTTDLNNTSTKKQKQDPPNAINTTLSFAAAEDKGHRNTLEDVWVVQNDARPQDSDSTIRLAMCGVFDGHAGRNAAVFASERLNNAVAPALLAACSIHVPTASSNTTTNAIGKVKLNTKAARAAIVKGFTDTDTDLLSTAREQGWVDGATAVVAWVLDETVLVANVGDAKAVLARVPEASARVPSGQQKNKPTESGTPTESSTPASQSVEITPKAIVLTMEHKAIHKNEMDRIVKARGRVVNGRVDGRLEVSRAFGDAEFKYKGLSCVPDITAFTIIPGRDRFLLLACDGYFTVVSPQDAVEQVTRLLRAGHDAKGVCVRLLHEAIRERRCKDNCTIVLCVFGV